MRMQQEIRSTSLDDVPRAQLSRDRQHISPVRLDEIEVWLVAARPRLHRLAQLRGVPPDSIEDVVQETLLEAWRHLDRLYAPEGLQKTRGASNSFIYRIPF